MSRWKLKSYLLKSGSSDELLFMISLLDAQNLTDELIVNECVSTSQLRVHRSYSVSYQSLSQWCSIYGRNITIQLADCMDACSTWFKIKSEHFNDKSFWTYTIKTYRKKYECHCNFPHYFTHTFSINQGTANKMLLDETFMQITKLKKIAYVVCIMKLRGIQKMKDNEVGIHPDISFFKKNFMQSKQIT